MPGDMPSTPTVRGGRQSGDRPQRGQQSRRVPRDRVEVLVREALEAVVAVGEHVHRAGVAHDHAARRERPGARRATADRRRRPRGRWLRGRGSSASIPPRSISVRQWSSSAPACQCRKRSYPDSVELGPAREPQVAVVGDRDDLLAAMPAVRRLPTPPARTRAPCPARARSTRRTRRRGRCRSTASPRCRCRCRARGRSTSSHGRRPSRASAAGTRSAPVAPGFVTVEHAVDDLAPLVRTATRACCVGLAADDPRRAEVGRVAVEVDAGVDPQHVAGARARAARRAAGTPGRR